MRVILGIGNPGSRYSHNRHNVGFMFLDYIAEKHSLSFVPSKSSYYFAEGKIGEAGFSLVKPSTYVNNSGIAASEIIDNYGIDLEDLLIVHDDVNLGLAELKVKVAGGDGGHNGLSSIIYHLSSNQFPRLRIGVGNDFPKGNMADYVLSDFDVSEDKELIKTFEKGTVLVEEYVSGGVKRLLDANSKLSSQKDDENNNENQSKVN